MAAIIDLAVFILVLFVVLPGIMIFTMLMRDIAYQKHNRKHAGWHNEAAGKATW
jgi:hypothetical protein